MISQLPRELGDVSVNTPRPLTARTRRRHKNKSFARLQHTTAAGRRYDAPVAFEQKNIEARCAKRITRTYALADDCCRAIILPWLLARAALYFAASYQCLYGGARRRRRRHRWRQVAFLDDADALATGFLYSHDC